MLDKLSINKDLTKLTLIDLYHSAAMLSLRGIKALFPHSKPQPDANSVRDLPCRKKAFYSPETQHGRCLIKV